MRDGREAWAVLCAIRDLEGVILADDDVETLVQAADSLSDLLEFNRQCRRLKLATS